VPTPTGTVPHFRVVLGGVMVIVLAIGAKVCGFKPGRGDGILRAIKIHRFPSQRK
jgi:hypothetical protein